MPKESRKISFENNELKVALQQFSAREGLTFKPENIQAMELGTKDEIGVSLKVFDASADKVGTVSYSHAQVAAALIAYCMFLKIPLPRAGKKSVKRNEEGELYLNIHLKS